MVLNSTKAPTIANGLHRCKGVIGISQRLSAKQNGESEEVTL
jgi:hypothetical protein